jgi:hypothetical protein
MLVRLISQFDIDLQVPAEQAQKVVDKDDCVSATQVDRHDTSFDVII